METQERVRLEKLLKELRSKLGTVSGEEWKALLARINGIKQVLNEEAEKVVEEAEVQDGTE